MEAVPDTAAEPRCPRWNMYLIPGTLSALMWLAVFPLLHTGSYLHITLGKWQWLERLTWVNMAWLPLAGLLLMMTRRGRHTPSLSSRLKAASLPLTAFALMLAYFGWVALSARFGALHDVLNKNDQPAVWYGAMRYEGLQTQLMYLLIFVSAVLLPVSGGWLTGGIALSVLCFAGISALQYMDCNPFGLYPAPLSMWTNYEFQSTMGNIDMVSAYLCAVLPLLLGDWLLSGGKRGALSLLSGASGLLMLVLTRVQSGMLAMGALMVFVLYTAWVRPETRRRAMVIPGIGCLCLTVRSCLQLPWMVFGETNEQTVERIARAKLVHDPILWQWTVPGILLLCAGIVLLLLPLLRRNWGRRGIRPRTAVCTLLAVLCIALLAVYMLPAAPGSGAVYELHELLHLRPQKSFGSDRVGIWQMALESIGEHPLFGTGPDTFLNVFRAKYPSSGMSLKTVFDMPHNLLLGIASNNGIPAAVFFLAAVLLMLIAQAKRRTSPLPALCCVCYLIQSMFTFSICMVSPIFWVMAGLALRGLRGSGEKVENCGESVQGVCIDRK